MIQNEYLERLLEYGERKDCELTIMSLTSYTNSWHINLKCRVDGVQLDVANRTAKDFDGGVMEVVTQFERHASRPMLAPQIEHKPETPPTTFNRTLDDEIPF